jgi:hypothetical protein
MLLVVTDIITNQEHTYKLYDVSDFDGIFHDYPRLKTICYRCNTVKEAAEAAENYLNSRCSRLKAHLFLNSPVAKSEEVAVPPQKKESLIVNELDLSNNIKKWAEKRSKPKQLPRDTTFSPDPGKIRNEELDEKAPSTLFQKIKAAIKGK